MKDLHTTAGYALAISFVVTVLCWYYLLGPIPTGSARQGIIGVLLAPELWMIEFLRQEGFAHISRFVLIPLALFAQFIGYAILIHVIRLILRAVRSDRQ